MIISLKYHSGLLLAGLFLTTFQANAQNLVPNPSFENYHFCPFTISSIDTAKPWFTPSTATPDYFNNCAPVSSLVNAPATFGGFQSPRTGNGFGGLFSVGDASYREYISVELTEPLETDVEYCVRFYAAPTDSNTYYNNKLGMLFSETALSSSTFDPIIANAQVVSDELITDTQNWTEISGSFIANGNELFLTIGCFDPIADMTIVPSGVPANPYTFGYAYYFIEDVEVQVCEVDTIPDPVDTLNPVAADDYTIYIPNSFTPDGDGLNDVLFVKGNGIEQLNFYIYNRWGELIFESDDLNKGWDGTVNNRRSPDAVYTYDVNVRYTNDTYEQLNGHISLVR